MDEFLSKTVVLLLTPAFGILLLLVVALVLAVTRHFKISLGVISLAAVAAWVCAMPAVSEHLLKSLEMEYPSQAVEGVPKAECMVVLGDAFQAAKDQQAWQRGGSTEKRAAVAAELYDAGKTDMVIVSAGNPPYKKGQQTEAEVIRNLMSKRGVPQDAMILEMSARNRRENALYSRNIMENIGCGSPLLVASASRMGLAEAAFQTLGVSVAPVAADYRAAQRSPSGVDALIPTKEAFSRTSEALRERVTRAMYRFQNWA